MVRYNNQALFPKILVSAMDPQQSIINPFFFGTNPETHALEGGKKPTTTLYISSDDKRN